MITIYGPQGVRTWQAGEAGLMDAVRSARWIDLLMPGRDEELLIERALDIDVPTRSEMQALESSSRLYEENGGLFMTATILAYSDTDKPESAAVTFILLPTVLISLRYADPRPFRVITQHFATRSRVDELSSRIFMTLLSAVIDRLADVLERVTVDLDNLSRDIFSRLEPGNSDRDGNAFKRYLLSIGRSGDLVARIRESLTSVSRLHSFVAEAERLPPTAEYREQLATLRSDLASLSDHSAFLGSKVAFLLDATLGMVSIEQNGIIKTLSVAATVFLPPTLIASIYGMNFEHMWELRHPIAYPIVLGLIVLSGALPYWFFRRKGWV